MFGTCGRTGSPSSRRSTTLRRSVGERYLSPLRYPGGKGRLGSFVASLIAAQPRRASRYVEPFAGGAGVGLSLLFHEHVDEIVLNDIDVGIAAFWRALFSEPDEFIARVRNAEVTIDEWHRQREVHLRRPDDDISLGFATFFLNRTNRSGILGGRPIGGLNQTGKWLIDARYDGERLAERIRRLSTFASRVTICSEDGINLVGRELADDDAFIYIDPPYLQKGDDLYLDTLQWEDHERLAAVLADARGWFLTYDHDPRVLRLYPHLRCASFGIAHTAGVQHVGREYAVFAAGLVLPPLSGLGHEARLVGRRQAKRVVSESD